MSAIPCASHSCLEGDEIGEAAVEVDRDDGLRAFGDGADPRTSTDMHHVSGSTSTKTGVAPT